MTLLLFDTLYTINRGHRKAEGLTADELAIKNRPFKLQGFITQDHQGDSAAIMLSQSHLIISRLGWRVHVMQLGSRKRHLYRPCTQRHTQGPLDPGL